ncbi:MAG: hypothetical protein WB760_14320 [Xanthobacteraceae bacterium]
MAEESKFVRQVLDAVRKRVLPSPLFIEQGRVLLYQITLNNKLETTVEAKKFKKPTRGDSAFQTDLCVIETTADGIELPRVVLEFKASISTHDVLTYSAKARKHKQVYPYLRYGVVVAHEAVVPHRFFIHNEALDFFAPLKNNKEAELGDYFFRLIEKEVATSRLMERIAFDAQPTFFRSEIQDRLDLK